MWVDRVSCGICASSGDYGGLPVCGRVGLPPALPCLPASAHWNTVTPHFCQALPSRKLLHTSRPWTAPSSLLALVCSTILSVCFYTVCVEVPLLLMLSPVPSTRLQVPQDQGDVSLPLAFPSLCGSRHGPCERLQCIDTPVGFHRL